MRTEKQVLAKKSSRQQRHGQERREDCSQKCHGRRDSGISLPSPAVQMLSLEQPPGLLTHTAEPLPLMSWRLGHELSSQSPDHQRGEKLKSLTVSPSPASLGRGTMAWSPLLPATLVLTLTLTGVGGVRAQLQLRHQHCVYCHAHLSMEEKHPTRTLLTFGALGTAVCGAGTHLPLLSGHNKVRTADSFLGRSCWAAGCPPVGQSSPMASPCYAGAPWRRQLSAKAIEMLLGGCMWAAVMSPVCPWLGGES